MTKELTFAELKAISSDDFSLDGTEVACDRDLLGQDKSFNAIDEALTMNDEGYNIYLAGHSVLNKAKYIKKYIEEKTADLKTPDDWCYVYNFEEPSSPKPIRLGAGMGREFKQDMKAFISELESDLMGQFESIEFQLQKNKISNRLKEKNELLMKQMKVDAKEYDFETQITDKDIYFIPIVDGVKLSEEMFEALSEEEQDDIVHKSEVLQQRATKVLNLIQENQKEAEKRTAELQRDIALILLRHTTLKLLDKYEAYEEVCDYLIACEKDITESIDDWITVEDSEDSLMALLPSVYKTKSTDHRLKYRVNLLVDNSETKGPPVVYGLSPSFYNLTGKIEYENDLGSLKSDLMKIKPGLLHKANGGYLIIEVDELLKQSYSWYILKLILKTNKIHFKEIRDLSASLAESLQPNPIPLDVKIILIGESMYYQLLAQYDSSFKNFFRMKIYFDNEASKTESNKEKLVSFIIHFIKEKGMTSIEKTGILAVMKYATRLVMDKDKFSSDLEPIRELLMECCHLAKKRNVDLITEEMVDQTIKNREMRLNYVEERLDELISKNHILINVQGSKVGQINALAVIDIGDYAFGKPSRVTATTYKGKAGIINIEKEVNMSGKVHDKGVHVLTGYLGHKYAQESPLSLTCQICFEQNYSYVDGDSASSAELYAIISSLSGIPIKQSLAVTGSMNQFGEIQPIGGVTYKVEGFYNVCKKRGLTGEQGVIVPYQNLNDLVLKQEIIDAVGEGKFHIYPVQYVDEAMSLLMDRDAEEIHKVIEEKLLKQSEKKN